MLTEEEMEQMNEISPKEGDFQELGPVTPKYVAEVKEKYRFAAERLKNCGVDKVLDLGCGFGIGAKVLIDQGFDVTGIEKNEEMVEWCNDYDVPAERRDAEEIASDSPILALDVIEHFDSVEPVRRWVESGVPVVLRTPNRETHDVDNLFHPNEVAPQDLRFGEPMFYRRSKADTDKYFWAEWNTNRSRLFKLWKEGTIRENAFPSRKYEVSSYGIDPSKPGECKGWNWDTSTQEEFLESHKRLRDKLINRFMLSYEEMRVQEALTLLALCLKEGVFEWGETARVLDYGCGATDFGLVFKLAGHEVSLCDVPPMLDFAEWRFEQRGLNFTRIEVEGGLPELEEEFDLIVCSEILEHLHRPVKALERLAGRTEYLWTSGWPFTDRYYGNDTDHPEAAHEKREEVAKFIKRNFDLVGSEAGFLWRKEFKDEEKV